MTTETDREADFERMLDDYWYFAGHVSTEWEEATFYSGVAAGYDAHTIDPNTPVEIQHARYPVNWDFLRRYHEEYTTHRTSATFKSRGMIASTDPLVWSLWQMIRAEHGRISVWRTAIVRQSERDAELLVMRARAILHTLPPWVLSRITVTRDNDGELEIAHNNCIRALHAKGDSGRGEGWNLVVFDELAFQQEAERNWGGFQRALIKMAVSTVNGSQNFFAKLCGKCKASERIRGVHVIELGFEEHPDRKPGTPEGDAWISWKRGQCTHAQWQQEYMRNWDVFAEPGLYTADWDEGCVSDDVTWDGISPLVVCWDPGYWGAGCVLRYFSEHHVDVKLKCWLFSEMKTWEQCKVVIDYIKNTYPGAGVRLTGDIAAKQERSSAQHTDQQIIVRMFSEAFADCVYDKSGNCIEGDELPYETWRLPKVDRKSGHNLIRMSFRARSGDGRHGTLIHRTGCADLITAYRGAYKQPKNATPRQEELEEPDRSQPCVHLCDADRAGHVQFAEAGGIPTFVRETKGQDTTRHVNTERGSPRRGAAAAILARHTRRNATIDTLTTKRVV